MIAGRWTMSGMDRMCCWISGARLSIPITWVTRARVIPSRRAISAWLAASPDSRRVCHLMALRRSSTTRGRPGILGRFRFTPARCDGAHDSVGGHTARQGADVGVLEGPLGPRAISTVCFR